MSSNQTRVPDEPTTAAALADNFQEPPAWFRAKPFWAWNTRLDEAELRRQIRIFKEMGFGGFFMHARVGLDTPYLGSEWFDLVRACIDEAQKTGTEAWLYDEDRWPSGAAGGLATADPKYGMRTLWVSRCRRDDNYEWPQDGDAAYLFAAVFDDDKLVSYEPVSSAADLAAQPLGTELIEFVLKPAPCRRRSWFNNRSYLDTLSEEAVGKFIEVTHEKYRQEVGEHFGKTVPGIFTDEPNHGGMFRNVWAVDGCLPWTAGLPRRFQEMFGYDVIARLPELAYDLVDGGRPDGQVRYHYCRCKARMFAQAFAKTIGEWCNDNNLFLTGHVQEERPISNNISMCGSTMQFYSHMQLPGIDIVRRFRMEFLIPKQCASVARQMGCKWVLSEMYGATGWPTTFEIYKHNGDWQTVLGITMRCPHVSWYSMAGEAKRDYPASIHFQSPWWRQYRHLETYFSRLHVVLGAGDPVCDLAVIHPVESYYVLINAGWVDDTIEPAVVQNERIREMDEQAELLVEWLTGRHLDFDFADEELIVDFDAKTGEDERGVYLQIGRMKYRAVLVPQLLTLRRSTLGLLEQFSQLGGQVVFIGKPPGLVDALDSNEASDFARDKTVPFDSEAVAAALEDKARSVSIRDDAGNEATDILCQLRRIGNDLTLFLVNNSRECAHDSLRVRIDAVPDSDSHVQRWDPVTGERLAYPGRVTAGAVEFDVDLPRSGSALFVVAGCNEVLPAWHRLQPAGPALKLDPGKWEFALDDHNVLVLDRPDCHATADGMKAFRRRKMEILELDNELHDYLDIPHRGGAMVQPWVDRDQPLGPTAETTLTYSFNVRSLPTMPVLLAVEQPERWAIELNGRPLTTTMITGWWVDPAIKTITIDPAQFRRGRNTVSLKGQFDRLTDLEIVYLLGQFGVRVDGGKAAMTRLPARLTLGSWLPQGLPFYAGGVVYRTTFRHQKTDGRRYLLKLPSCNATVMEMSLNNAEPVIIAFPDFELDITEQLQDGRNAIAIKLISSRRNAFGPLHMIEDEPYGVGPGTYRPVCPQQDAFKLVEYGMLEPPVIVEC